MARTEAIPVSVLDAFKAAFDQYHGKESERLNSDLTFLKTLKVSELTLATDPIKEIASVLAVEEANAIIQSL